LGNDIPEAMPAQELLERLWEQKSHLALIIDEFCGLMGMVTITDVLEAIVGDIPTLDDQIEDPDFIEREDGSYLLNGMLSMEELKDLLDMDELPEEENSGYETLGGMLMAELGGIPRAGDAIFWDRWRFEVMDMDGYRVDKVLVSAKPENPAAPRK
jgi:putative hemolysin